MYACTAGKLTHAYACEMDEGAMMLLDMSDNYRISGAGSLNTPEEKRGVIIPNHTCLAITRLCKDKYELVLAKGNLLPRMIPGVVMTYGAPDPRMLP